jgi:chromate transporter
MRQGDSWVFPPQSKRRRIARDAATHSVVAVLDIDFRYYFTYCHRRHLDKMREKRIVMTAATHNAGNKSGQTGSALEVFLTFLVLGVTCFGGPVAHIGYFRDAFVTRRRWLDERAYADLVALCQFLPGPASSQVGFAVGLMRAGLPGGLAAWAGFTLPSAAALVAFAYGADTLSGPAGAGLLHGLKLVAVAIVAQAVWGMARTLCPDRERASIAVAAALIVLFDASPAAQVAAIVLGGVAGLWLCRTPAGESCRPGTAGVPPAVRGGEEREEKEERGGRNARGPRAVAAPVSRPLGLMALGLFFILLVGLPLLRGLTGSQGAGLVEAFYRSGALVFGGGHVVLPLLRESFVTTGFVNDDTFLAGYGAAQAVPGPLFTFAAYLGAVAGPSPHGPPGAAIGWAAVGLIAIFLPGILILIGTLPFWEGFRTRPEAQAITRGINAAVVGLLGAALYNPVWTSAVRTPRDFAIALVGFILLTVWRAPPLLVVALCALGGMAFAQASP